MGPRRPKTRPCSLDILDWIDVVEDLEVPTSHGNYPWRHNHPDSRRPARCRQWPFRFRAMKVSSRHRQALDLLEDERPRCPRTMQKPVLNETESSRVGFRPGLLRAGEFRGMFPSPSAQKSWTFTFYPIPTQVVASKNFVCRLLRW